MIPRCCWACLLMAGVACRERPGERFGSSPLLDGDRRPRSRCTEVRDRLDEGWSPTGIPITAPRRMKISGATGSRFLAVADGEITQVVDGIPEILRAFYPSPSRLITLQATTSFCVSPPTATSRTRTCNRKHQSSLRRSRRLAER